MTNRLRTIWLTAAVLGIAAIGAASIRADEKLAGIACRSVHLAFLAGEGVAFYNEFTPEKTAPGTYFMVCGFNVGYFGMQELGDGKKLVLFSVWDPGEQNNPNQVEADKQVKVVEHDPKVRVKRFGGEGTGGQSFFDYDWKLGETYRFLVTSTTVEGRSAFTGYLYIPEDKQWKKLVTFSTIATKKQLKGFYSFVEDFKRDRVSATKTRQARFGNGWVKPLNGDWLPLDQARFTADANTVVNIDAGPIGDRFFLATGGEITNVSTKLRASMQATRPAGDTVPADVIELLKLK